MSPITTHVLDVSRGRPASGVPVALAFRQANGRWKILARRTTDQDGRVPGLLPKGSKLVMGFYRLIFNTAAYFRSTGAKGFYPEVSVLFHVRDSRHHHVPLLLSPFGYSTYRGS